MVEVAVEVVGPPSCAVSAPRGAPPLRRRSPRPATTHWGTEFGNGNRPQVVCGAGRTVSSFEVDADGKIVVRFGEPEKPEPASELQQWLSSRRHVQAS